MNNLNVLTTFVGGLSVALVFGYAAQRLRVSPVVGYLIAGITVGPFTPGFVADRQVAEQFAEIGVILLMFGIGLRFHLRELIAVWRTAVPGALIQSVLSTAALALLMRAVGWDWRAGIVLGMAVSVASTVVMARVLADHGDLHTPIGHIAVGWTVVEDLLTVVLLLILPIVFSPASSGSPQGIAGALGAAGLKVVGLVLLVAVLGRFMIPWLLEQVETTRSRELFTLAVLTVAMGIAVGSARVFGVSMALGAFLAGLAVGRSDFAARAAGDALPMRDAFAVLFFVSVGMLVNPRTLVEAPLTLGLVLTVVVVGKFLASVTTVRLLGRPLKTAVPVGAALAQVGEFSFILGTAAQHLGVIGDAAWNALVAASIVSIALNPLVYRAARQLSSRVRPRRPTAAGKRPDVDPRRCVLVGYGPVGRTVHRILSDHGTVVIVVELNLETVRELRAVGQAAVYGDVLRPGVLEEAGIDMAGGLILSVEIEDADEVVRQARLINPELRVLARCAHLREVEKLRRIGATAVAGEAEVAVALAETLTGAKGGSPEELSGHRETVRRRLYDDLPG